MAEFVDRKILAAAEPREIGMGDTAAPHDFTHGVVVFLILDGYMRSFHDCLEEGFGHAVGEGIFPLCRS